MNNATITQTAAVDHEPVSLEPGTEKFSLPTGHTESHEPVVSE
jgi:hypothetical protein